MNGYRQADREALERGTDLVDFARLISRQWGDGGALVHLDPYPAFTLELAQGLANRDRADGEVPRDCVLAQVRAGGEGAVNDRRAQRVRDHARGAAALSER